MKRAWPWRTISAMIMCLALGAATGGGVVTWVYYGSYAQLVRELNSRKARITMLESLASNVLIGEISRPLTNEMPVAPPAQAAVVASVAPLRQPPPAPVSARQQPPAAAAIVPQLANVLATAPRAVASQAVPAVSPPIAEPTMGVAPAAAPLRPAPTPEEIERASRGLGPIEGVTYEKASVEKLEKNAVRMNGGRAIVPGQIFPSGERLLAVDPENSRIVTDRRQILLFRGGSASQGDHGAATGVAR